MGGLLVNNLAAAGPLGLSAFDDSSRVELRPDWTEAELQSVFRAAYRQVLGNDYIMKSERLVSAESLLRQGMTTVRDFVRAIAKSDLYKSKFFYRNSNQRFVELNFKHLLGRAPYDEAEWGYHTGLCEEQGYDAEIDSYIDSMEYENKFGNNVVPYYTGFQVEAGVRTTGFTRMFRLYRGYASSDRGSIGGKSPRLTRELGQNFASRIDKPSGGGSGASGWKHAAIPDDAAPRKALGGTQQESGRVYRIEVTGILQPGYPKVRRSSSAILVPYEQLSQKLQEITKKGGKIVNVSRA
ncbi:phycobilisome linker polypeptide [Myxacorys almedinensis]|uniref:Photosystem I reaction center subunit XII n=1 Tax=Myxacorys almedinensis A TaxID=2690445 RepID=A0A8J8CJ13_9CYAN|nr:phycobilisome linker polypeptide [Myxacorys almedinensis]NDJ18184.1 photosystem I reaction center subunit XII [Myxacorys almedinensis A]